jgi:hypothetical protein
MTFTAYLQPSEYASYGISDSTSAQVAGATRLVDTYLVRPEGLLWSPDANGMAAYMTNKEPTLSFPIPATTNPGANVAVAIPNAQFGPQNIGEVVILDRLNPSLTEACVVTATGGNTLTLSSVQFAHAATATMDFGLTLFEELPVPSRRTTVRLSRTPVAQLLSGFGRYGYGRRSQQFAGPDVNTNLLAYVGAFGGPPMWTQFPISETDMNLNTGEVWIPPGLLLAYFSDVRLHYVAGWSQTNLPGNVKQAAANIVRSAIDNPISGNIKMLKAGDATIQRFSATALDDDTKSLLQPYRALLMV